MKGQGEFFGEEIDRIITGVCSHVAIFAKMQRAIASIEQELEERVRELKSQGKLLEAQRLEQRTRYDLEMMQEIGFCQGIENYSRHISGRAPGSPPFTLIDYFPLLIIDESHVTIPQIGAMYNGDRSRKESLVGQQTVLRRQSMKGSIRSR